MPRSDSPDSRRTTSPRGRSAFSAGGMLLMMFLVVAYAVVQWLAPADKPRGPATSERPFAENPESSGDDAPSSDRPSDSSDGEESSKTSIERSPSRSNATAKANAPAANTTTAKADSAKVIVRDMTIRNQAGDVVYRGDVDLTATLARIQRGERLKFPHDGTVFGNREKRLPAQKSGYYREWVHPTPKLSGPGPQRIVTGDRGEAYYTHDHYASFRKIR